MKVADEFRDLQLTKAEYEESLKLAAVECREMESLHAQVMEAGIFCSANEELQTCASKLEKDTRNNSAILIAALDAQEKAEEKLRRIEVLLAKAIEAANSNDKLAKKYERGWNLVSGASSILADSLLGDDCVLGEKEVDCLKKAFVEAEALMDTSKMTCAALIPDATLGRSAASLAIVLGHGPSKFERQKVSATHEGARMALSRVVSHYPNLTLGRVQEGVNPDKADHEALALKVEPAAWNL